MYRLLLGMQCTIQIIFHCFIQLLHVRSTLILGWHPQYLSLECSLLGVRCVHVVRLSDVTDNSPFLF